MSLLVHPATPEQKMRAHVNQLEVHLNQVDCRYYHRAAKNLWNLWSEAKTIDKAINELAKETMAPVTVPLQSPSSSSSSSSPTSSSSSLPDPTTTQIRKISDYAQQQLDALKKLKLDVITRFVLNVLAIPYDVVTFVAETINALRGPQFALLAVDVQKGFSDAKLDPKELYSQGGEEVVALINPLLSASNGLYKVASQDWHPIEHHSFVANAPQGSVTAKTKKETAPSINLRGLDDKEQPVKQLLWNTHCVQNTPGAEFASDLLVKTLNFVVQKGLDIYTDSYSAFFDNGNKNPSQLHNYFVGKNVKVLFATGIATDVCVDYSVHDALKLGYTVVVLEDACRGITTTTGAAKIAELRRAAVESSGKLHVGTVGQYFDIKGQLLADQRKALLETQAPKKEAVSTTTTTATTTTTTTSNNNNNNNNNNNTPAAPASERTLWNGFGLFSYIGSFFVSSKK